MSQEIVTLPPPTVTPMSLLQTAIGNGIDPDKLGKLIDLAEAWSKARAEESWGAAMNRCQAEMPNVVKDSDNPQTRSRYASLEAVQRVVKPCYTKHGFSLCFAEEDSPKEGWTRIVCDVTHKDGHTRRYRKDMPPNGEGIKGNRMMTETHAAGSTSSYGRRYLTCEIFNITIANEDDDGNAAHPPAKEAPQALDPTKPAAVQNRLINAAEEKELVAIIQEIEDAGLGDSLCSFWDWLETAKVKSLDQMPVRLLDGARRGLKPRLEAARKAKVPA